MSENIRFDLPQSEIPTHWYNIQADLPRPLPPVLHPGTHQPIGPADLSVLFPMELIMQEVSQAREIEIPEEVREIYKLWRPTPLMRARRLEKALDTPAHIYYKYEGVSPSGSHKLNTAAPQAYYNKQEGVFWKKGSYYWEVWIEGEKAGSKYFYIEDGGRLFTKSDNPYCQIAMLRTRRNTEPPLPKFPAFVERMDDLKRCKRDF